MTEYLELSVPTVADELNRRREKNRRRHINPAIIGKNRKKKTNAAATRSVRARNVRPSWAKLEVACAREEERQLRSLRTQAAEKASRRTALVELSRAEKTKKSAPVCADGRRQPTKLYLPYLKPKKPKTRMAPEEPPARLRRGDGTLSRLRRAERNVAGIRCGSSGRFGRCAGAKIARAPPE